MKKGYLGKFLTTALAATAMLSMSAPAMAATIGSNGTVTTNDNTLTIPKGIVLYNETSGQYYSPTINYTYSVAPATVAANATVNDGTNVSRVHAGPAGGLSVTTNPSFTSALNTMDSDGEEITSNLVLTVDPTAFGTTPGIYRYVLTDTTSESALYAAGMEREADYATTRYVDVYITRDTDGSMKVSGFVLLKENDTAVTSATDKSEGYVESDDAGTIPVGFDTYQTYNVSLSKDVEGTMGDRTHEFPFAISVVNNGYNYLYGEDEGSGIATYTDSSSAALTSKNLKHNDTVEIRGLNARATVAYTETIDVNDVYKVSVDGDGTTLIAEAPKTQGQTTVLAATHITDYETENSASDVKNDAARANNVEDVTFINKLDQISPTGLMLRYAPYILMLAVGGAILTIFRRRRTDVM